MWRLDDQGAGREKAPCRSAGACADGHSTDARARLWHAHGQAPSMQTPGAGAARACARTDGRAGGRAWYARRSFFCGTRELIGGANLGNINWCRPECTYRKCLHAAAAAAAQRGGERQRGSQRRVAAAERRDRERRGGAGAARRGGPCILLRGSGERECARPWLRMRVPRPCGGAAHHRHVVPNGPPPAAFGSTVSVSGPRCMALNTASSTLSLRAGGAGEACQGAVTGPRKGPGVGALLPATQAAGSEGRMERAAAL